MTAKNKSQNKTVATAQSVSEFINTQQNQSKEDCQTLDTLFSKLTGKTGVMWGASIVGYGDFHYKYDSGREGDFFLVGFSPRKQNLTIYIMAGFADESIMSRLGKYKIGKSCLYVKSLSDIDMEVLTELANHSIGTLQNK
ncbi:MAG: DUF1801 domain-containing protein [Flavobacteriales bacterium]|nr:DUF1801 domain-containing protein [Flavobacteriales bacterium]